jgi:hypothetical protein
MTIAVASCAAHADDVSATQAGPFNIEYTYANLHFGTHKSGVAQQPGLRFRGLNIPAGSTINSASIANDSYAITAGTGTFNALVKLLSFDGRWEATSLAAYWATTTSDDDWHVQLLDGAGVLVTTGAAASARQGGPDIGGDPGTVIQRIAQGVTITTGGNITTARVALGGLTLGGNPGNIWVEIWSDAAGLPGTLLGASNTRPVSDIAPKIWAEVRPTYDFTFTGGNIVAVSATDKVHAVLRCDVVGSGIHMGTWRYNYAGGNFSPYGTSPLGGFDIQNYFTVDDWWAIPTFGPTAAWTVPLTIATHTTPDLSALVQAHIDAVGYAASDPIGFRYDRVTSNGGVLYRAWPAAAGFPCTLTVDYTVPPAVPVIRPITVRGASLENVTARGSRL